MSLHGRQSQAASGAGEPATRPASLLLVGFVVLSAACPGGFREDEVTCEEAVERLGACCPSFAKSSLSLRCEYSEGGCGESETFPDLDVVRGRCLVGQSCGDIVGAGLCSNAPSDGGPATDTKASFAAKVRSLCP